MFPVGSPALNRRWGLISSRLDGKQPRNLSGEWSFSVPPTPFRQREGGDAVHPRHTPCAPGAALRSEKQELRIKSLPQFCSVFTRAEQWRRKAANPAEPVGAGSTGGSCLCSLSLSVVQSQCWEDAVRANTGHLQELIATLDCPERCLATSLEALLQDCLLTAR